MFTYIIAGAPGQGKSEFVKQSIEGRRCFVFDVQNEYGSRTKYKGQKALMLSDNPNDARARFLLGNRNIKEGVRAFMEMAKTKRDTIVVFEEATIFFEGRTDVDMRTLMVNRRHTGNVYQFIFHSINSIPPRIMEMSDYVVLHKTIDQDGVVMGKYNRIFPHFIDLQSKPDGSRTIIKLML